MDLQVPCRPGGPLFLQQARQVEQRRARR
ncbi:hypothetical protein GQ600_6238 [Phytophthora cactorum]|nr:hypothetical protein GQ600_6238 [Phytophthora cactorum]